MQTEEIAGITGAHLEQRNLESPALAERRTGLRIYTENGLAQEEVYGFFRVFSLVNQYDFTWEENPRQTVY